MKYFWYYLIFINLFAFCTYGIDKWKAKKGAWRVPEKTLLMITVPVIFVVEVILLIIWLL